MDKTCTKKMVDINKGLCIGCGKCVDLCAKNIIYIDGKTNKRDVMNE